MIEFKKKIKDSLRKNKKIQLSKVDDEDQYDEAGNKIDEKNQMKYTDYNHAPMALLSKNQGNYVDGYSLLPPKAWYKSPHPIKMYKDDCDCETQGVYVNTLGSNLEWKEKITPKDELKKKDF